MFEYAAKPLMFIGASIFFVGLIIWLGGASLFGWIGNLPGDIKIENERFKFYFPVSTMIVVSAIISMMIWVGKKIF